MKQIIMLILSALRHAEDRLNTLEHNYDETDFGMIREAREAGEIAVADDSEPVLWIELYNLARNSGITFPAHQFTACGDIFRVQLVVDGDFYLLPRREDRDWEVDGVTYTDFGASSDRFHTFKQVDPADLNLREF